LIVFYGVDQILNFISQQQIMSFEQLQNALPENTERLPWKNIGGQLIPETELSALLTDIRKSKIGSWDEVHGFYEKNSKLYPIQKLQHAYTSLLELLEITPSEFTQEVFEEAMERALETKQWMVKSIYESRAKDYENEFRKMSYDSTEEMEEVLGKLDDNIFIQNQEEELNNFRSQIDYVTKRFQLKKAPVVSQNV
jgi:hypothetical protein